MELNKIKPEAARVNKGYTQAQAAQLIGVHRTTILNYEKGKTSPKIRVLEKMAEVYGVPAHMLDFSKKQLSENY